MPSSSSTVSTQRTRGLSPGEIANIPAGRLLHLDGPNWQLLTVTPAHTVEPWKWTSPVFVDTLICPGFGGVGSLELVGVVGVRDDVLGVCDRSQTVGRRDQRVTFVN